MKVDKYLSAITGKYREDLYNYMAAVYRGEKVYKALLLQGGRNTGKSRISRLMGAKQTSGSRGVFNDYILREKAISVDLWEYKLFDIMVDFTDIITSTMLIKIELTKPEIEIYNETNVILEMDNMQEFTNYRDVIPVKLQKTDIIPEFTTEDEKIFIAYLKDNY